MQTIEILDIKNFMQLLFQTQTLDSYEFVSAHLSTDMTYDLDGRINSTFYSSEELESLQLTECTYLPWSLAKEKLFLLIKGKKTPSQMKIVLKLSSIETEELFNSSFSSLNSNDIHGVFLNIFFQENKLNVTCGISYKIFTLNKDLEDIFSDKIVTLFKSNNITCG